MTGIAEGQTDSRTREAVWEALSTVVDPELDEPITELGFVRLCTVTAGEAQVRLRLPTAFCAPNFAYMMTADAYDVVAALPQVRAVDVRLEDHHDSDQINAGVATQAGFGRTYATEAEGELDELRQKFRRKAHIACLERACKHLLADGWTMEGLATATLHDLVEDDRIRLSRRRSDLGLSVAVDSAALVDEDGTPIAAEDVSTRLRFARTVRVGIEGNAHFCRGLLAARYGGAEQASTTEEAS